jgi:hypothetical protein
MSELSTNGRDRLSSVAKSAAGALPFVGTMVGEIIDSVIPELRIERVVNFLKIIDERVEKIDEQLLNFQNNLKNEEGLDIFEEGIVQASRAVSEERKHRLARLVANSLSAEQLKYSEARKLLNIYNELTDPEIIWLIYYSLNPVIGEGPHSDWIDKHPDILKPISREMGAPQEQHERAALQDSYKATILRLGLTIEKNRSTNLTTLGHLLVRYINDEEN